MSLRREWFMVRWVAGMVGGLTAVMSLSAQAQLAPVVGTHYAARSSDTGFEGAVNSQGSYGASVPLDLPGARGGLPIPLQVIYGGNRVGAAGLGWDVPLSYIYRDTTIARRRPGREQLSMMVGGQRFVLVRNAANTAWLAQRNGAQLEVRDLGDGKMVMYDGEGRTYGFSAQGASAGSRLINSNLLLLVNIKGSDGNTVVLSYGMTAPTLPGGGSGLAINLASLSYNLSSTTANCYKTRVQLNYGAAASSPLEMSVLGGTVLARMQTLSGITVSNRGACADTSTVALHSYAFSYQSDIDTQLPRLQAVTRTGQQGTSEASVVLPVAEYSYGSIGDPTTRNITYLPRSHPRGKPISLEVHHGISHTLSTRSTEPHDPADALLDLATTQAYIDLNGDGRPDVAEHSRMTLNSSDVNATTTLSGTFEFPFSSPSNILSVVIGGAAAAVPDRLNPSVNDTLKQYIDMNGDGRVDIVETVLPDIDHWIIHLNKPNPTIPKTSIFVDISIPVTRMRAALSTTGVAFGRVPLARRTTVPAFAEEGHFEKRTITEFVLKDINGDGYPDFLYNAARVRPGGDSAQDLGAVKALINTAGVHLATGADLFAGAPIVLEVGRSSGGSGCGVGRWSGRPNFVADELLDEVCSFEDVNGDGIPDRINSVFENGQFVAKAALGTGIPTRPYATDAIITLPGPLARTETDLTWNGTAFVPDNCFRRLQTFDLHRTRGLRDINGDGIPDYVMQLPADGWRVQMGTGTGYAASVRLDSPVFELSLERSDCQAGAGAISGTPTGLFDIDGDGQPEIIRVTGTGGTQLWEFIQLQPPGSQAIDQADVGVVASVPAAGRLTQIKNGYGAVTRIGYKSAKENLRNTHNLPYPEIVVAAVATTDETGGQLLSTTRYAYDGSELIFDSASDAFVFPGYRRTVQLVGSNPAFPNEAVATITDTYQLESFSADAFPDAPSRFKRYRRVGQVSDVTMISGTIGSDPWALLNTNIANDTQRIAGAHYDHDARLLTSGRRDPERNEECVDMMFPYSFDDSTSRTNKLADTDPDRDPCTQIGFSFVKEVKSWRGKPQGDDPFASAATVKARAVVNSVDSLGRITEVALFNDVARNDDDLCVRTVYATPTGTNERVLFAPKTRTTTLAINSDGTANTDQPCASGGSFTTRTFASESWEYDRLASGSVAAGLVTGQTVSRRRTDDGSVINTNGVSDIRLFDATYDAAGNPLTVRTTREDGATSTVTMEYDPFGLAPTKARTDATNADGTTLPSLLTTVTRDPITLDATNTTDPNGAQAGNTFDGFGRVRLSTVTPSGGGASGVLSAIDYLGFADGSGRRIVQKVFTDPVAPENVATATGRTGTVFLDSLGRTLRTEVQLGADYGNKIMIVGGRNYTAFGRVRFEADPFPSDQSWFEASPFPSNRSFSTNYGTTYFFNTDGTPKCSIRGPGQQQLATRTDEANEMYPTCFSEQFESNRNLVSVVDPANPEVRHQSAFDALGRLRSRYTRAVDSNGVLVPGFLEAMDLDYDRLGNLSHMGRLLDLNTSAWVNTDWKHDSLGQVLELIEPNSETQPRTTQFRTYDNWGELTQVQWTDETTDRRTISQYDALGRTVHSEDRTGNVVDAETINDYLYDQPVNVTRPVVNATNVLGRLSKATSPTSTTSFSYDGLGRVNAMVFTDTTVSRDNVYVQKNAYHGDGAPDGLDLLLPDTGFAKTEHVAYTYDSAGRTRSVTYTDGSITQNVYTAAGGSAIDVFGRIRQAQYGAATYTATYADAGRRLINSMKVASPSGATREIAFPALPGNSIPAFDPLGRERARREYKDGVPSPAVILRSYDSLGQLQASQKLLIDLGAVRSDRSFTYDPLGNLLTQTDHTSGNAGSVTLSYQTTDRDRICSVAYGTATPDSRCNVSYDGVGNITRYPSRSGSTRTFTYFAGGQVKEVNDTNGNARARFRYDAFGVLQQLNLTSNLSGDTRTDRHFGELISQRDEIVAGVKRPVVTRTIPAPGVTATRHGFGSMDPWTFAFGEQRGNRFFTDQGGEFVQEVDYQPYGEANSSCPQPNSPTCGKPGSPTYSSEQWNGGDALAALGLSQLGARLYDPVIGRFLSRDPLIIPRTAVTTNPYAFANNDPVNLSDPTGLTVKQTGPAETPPGQENQTGGGGCFIICGDLEGWVDAIADAVVGSITAIPWPGSWGLEPPHPEGSWEPTPGFGSGNPPSGSPNPGNPSSPANPSNPGGAGGQGGGSPGGDPTQSPQGPENRIPAWVPDPDGALAFAETAPDARTQAQILYLTVKTARNFWGCVTATYCDFSTPFDADAKGLPENPTIQDWQDLDVPERPLGDAQRKAEQRKRRAERRERESRTGPDAPRDPAGNPQKLSGEGYRDRVNANRDKVKPGPSGLRPGGPDRRNNRERNVGIDDEHSRKPKGGIPRH